MKNCLICNKEFKGIKYCSQPCAYKAMEINYKNKMVKPMFRVNTGKLEQTPYMLKNEIITCTEQLPNCLNKFIPTRRDQPDICFKCLVTLGIDEAFPPLPPTKTIKV